jgi:hypothetical protein
VLAVLVVRAYLLQLLALQLIMLVEVAAEGPLPEQGLQVQAAVVLVEVRQALLVLQIKEAEEAQAVLIIKAGQAVLG